MPERKQKSEAAAQPSKRPWEDLEKIRRGRAGQRSGWVTLRAARLSLPALRIGPKMKGSVLAKPVLFVSPGISIYFSHQFYQWVSVCGFAVSVFCSWSLRAFTNVSLTHVCYRTEVVRRLARLCNLGWVIFFAVYLTDFLPAPHFLASTTPGLFATGVAHRLSRASWKKPHGNVLPR